MAETEAGTAILEIYGSSDDTMGCYGLPYSQYTDHDGDEAMDDFDCCANHDGKVWPFDIETQTSGNYRVIPVYNGNWQFLILPKFSTDDIEFDPMSNLEISWKSYSQYIRFSVPTHTKVKWLGSMSFEDAVNCL